MSTVTTSVLHCDVLIVLCLILCVRACVLFRNLYSLADPTFTSDAAKASARPPLLMLNLHGACAHSPMRRAAPAQRAWGLAIVLNVLRSGSKQACLDGPASA